MCESGWGLTLQRFMTKFTENGPTNKRIEKKIGFKR